MSPQAEADRSTARVNVRLPPALVRRLKRTARRNKTTVAELVAVALEQFLNPKLPGVA